MILKIEIAGDVDVRDFSKFLADLHAFLMEKDRRVLIKDITIDQREATRNGLYL